MENLSRDLVLITPNSVRAGSADSPRRDVETDHLFRTENHMDLLRGTNHRQTLNERSRVSCRVFNAGRSCKSHGFSWFYASYRTLEFDSCEKAPKGKQKEDAVPISRYPERQAAGEDAANVSSAIPPISCDMSSAKAC